MTSAWPVLGSPPADVVHLVYAGDAGALRGVQASISSVRRHASERVALHYIGDKPFNITRFSEVEYIPLQEVAAEHSLTRFLNPKIREGHSDLNSLANYVRFVSFCKNTAIEPTLLLSRHPLPKLGPARYLPRP